VSKEYLTPEKVAKILDVNIETVYRWLNKGVLPGVKIGGLWRVRKEDIDLKFENQVKVK